MTPEDLATATPERPVRVGRYDVVGSIGAGGMGAVYDAIDREHGSRVALKTLTQIDAESLRRFKTEFRSVADLSHPNLVSLYELGCQDDLWWFTMERVDGVDLIEWLRGPWRRDRRVAEVPSATTALTERTDVAPAPSSRDLLDATPSPVRSIPRLRDALGQLARGVRALHAAGLLHLDIKPSNVLVDREGRVVLLDFGLVRAIDAPAPASADPNATTISGTPAWMAPERYVGGRIGEPADWYSVGLMLYLALTGVPAFASASYPLVSFAKLHAPPVAPDRLLPDVPADLSALAIALLEPDPAARPGGDVVAATLSDGPRGAARAARQAPLHLVGREVERARIAEVLGRVADGDAAVVHLVGPSGIGKTTLLAALRDEARQRGALVLSGRCYERETVPYKALDGILDELAAHLASRPMGEVVEALPAWIDELSHVFPVLAGVPAIEARLGDARPSPTPASILELRRRGVLALRELFAALATRRPLVLEIDDLQWADADSAAALSKLVEAPAPRGLLLAASFRELEAGASSAAPYLESVGAFEGLVRIDVGPLPRPEAERLAEATLASLELHVDGLATLIADEAAGVPFFVHELAHDAAEGQGAPLAGGALALDGVLVRRVRALAPEQRALVEVLAVAESPIPLAVALAVARVGPAEAARASWALRRGRFVRVTGAAAGDRVELQHDRLRESVLRTLSPARVGDHQLALGRALAAAPAEAWLFDAVRHLNAVADRLGAEERLRTARLDLTAGQRARRAAAFPLAFDCLHAGVRLLEATAWQTDYELCLALHAGAAETAYLSAAWTELDRYIAAVKANGRTTLDQLVAWELQIDAAIARREYDAAVDAALEALRLLGVELPAAPGEADVGRELERAMAALARVGPGGLAGLPKADDPVVTAAMRIESRISSAAYFARPMLLPVIACRLVATSVERGLSPSTPYALSIYGIVLNTLGMHREAHAWGEQALELLERFDDRSLEARTRHVVHDLVCTWTVPLASTLASLRRVVDIGKETGDVEYAAYAAHAYVHNSFYACRELGALLEEALALGAFMRGHEQVNALHVHEPFEQALRCLTGRARDPARLDGDGFLEAEALAAAEAAGSRSAQCIVRLLMGIVRFHFGTIAEASACFEAARPFLDGVSSTWHVPMLHQYAALAIHSLPDAQRRTLAEPAAASLAALRALAEHGPENFAHRVDLVEAAAALAEGHADAALARARGAAAGAERGGWLADLGLAHELAARADPPAAARHLGASRDAYARWGMRAERRRASGDDAPGG